MAKLVTKGNTEFDVDDALHPFLSAMTWYDHPNGNNVYAAAQVNGRIVYLHRFIMEINSGRKLTTLEAVDHIDRNTFNTRLSNLRIIGAGANAQNKVVKNRPKTSIFSGVSGFGDKWKASIAHKKEDVHLGIFPSEIEAAKVYDLAAVKYYGEGAHLNFPGSLEFYLAQLSAGVNPKKSKTVVPTSKFDGVSWNKASKSWVANITIQKERRYLGIFQTEEEAAKARDLGAIKLIGRHATLNFPKLRQEYITQLENGFDPIPTKHVRSSKFKGVTLRKDIGGGRWQAYVTEDGKRKFLPGTFETDYQAKDARDAYLKSR